MKIALVIGHSQKSKGAKNISSNVSEFDYNERLAFIIKTMSYANIEIIYRDTYRDLPTKINLSNSDYVISLHCNAFNKRATGTETLYYHTSERGKKLAKLLQASMVDTLMLPDRGIRPKTAEDRGGYLLKYTIAPCVILEPFFIDNNNDYNIGLNLIDELAHNISEVLEGL